jgi:hypothetical protein
LRRASKRFWLLVSVVVMAALAMQVGSGAGGPKRVNELTLAGLRPGRDLLQKARRSSEKFPSYAEPDSSPVDGELVRRDLCHREQLTILARTDGVIQSVVVGGTTGAFDADCEFNLKPSPWITGRGLRYRDHCDRIEEIYGKAESRSPSVKGSDKLELYLYKFDWAGTDVPQVMEVSCDASSQTVAEITLAAATL